MTAMPTASMSPATTYQGLHQSLSQPGVLPAGAHAMMENEYMMTTPSMMLQSTMATAMRENQGNFGHPLSSEQGRIGTEQVMPSSDISGGNTDSLCK